MDIGSIFKNIADGVGMMIGRKSGPAISRSDFFDADDYNGSGFFRSAETMVPSDYYTGWGHTGISTIANHVAILEKVLENEKGDPIKNNPVFEMLKFEMLRDLVSFLEIYGRAYAWRITTPDGKKILGVEVLNPDGVKVCRWSQSSGRFGVMRYEYTNNNSKWIIKPEDMIVFTYFHPLQAYPYNQDRGMSGLAASDFVIDADKKSDIWNGKIFDNSGYAGNVLQTEQALAPEVTKRIADKWDNDHKGIKNGHKTAVLTHGLKQAEGKNQKDMDFSKMKEVARDVILGRLKMPKSVIWLSDGVNVGNVVAFDRIFSRRTILPIAILLQEGFNRGLFAGVGKLRFLNVVPTDADEILRFYAVGLLTKNQALTELGYDPIGPDGDTYIADPFSVETPSTTPQAGTNDGDNAVPKSGIEVSYAKCLDLSRKLIDAARGKTPLEMQSDAWMEKEFIEFKKRNDGYEVKFTDKLRKVFTQQEKYILKKIEGAKTYEKKAAPTLSKADWYEVYYMALFDVVTDIMKAEGAKARAQIGLSGAFNVSNDKVRDMIIEQVKALQISVDALTNQKLGEAFAAADTTFDATKAVGAIFEELSTTRVKTIARSETVRAGTDATIAQWKESKVVVSKVWYTVEDERTCEFCGAMHNTTVGLDEVYFEKGDTLKTTTADGVPVELPLDYEDTSGPPLHPNCRCRLKAVLKK